MNAAFLLPLPFLLASILALIFPKKRALGILGVIAGITTLALLFSLAPGTHRAPWFEVGDFTFEWGVLLDTTSILLVTIVAGIGTFIFLYSIGYLDPSESLKRFYAELALFAAGMIGVITSANLLQLFFCWEIVGISSYLLIGFWYSKESAVAAARKAFTTILIGDAFLLLGILALRQFYGTFDIPTILLIAQANGITVLAGVCIIIGAISKSAQFPLHAWLPDAMEGPTPVSAFLHSATMVKAGLFLIVRMLPLLALVGLSPLLVAIAVITIIISGCCALVETDIKRVLAYSTMNQLAFILLAFGIGTAAAVTAGLYHLLNHSIFKALLFMAAGAIIHLAGTQDIAKMNIKTRSMLGITTLCGVLALAGVPPFSGFFSKDGIFEAVLGTGNLTLIIVFCVAIIMSVVYIFRWYFLIFKKDGFVAHLHWQMKTPLPILAFATVLGGFAMSPFYAWIGERVHFGIASVISVFLVLIGFTIAYLIYRKAWNISWASSSGLTKFFEKRFLLDDLYGFLANMVLELSHLLSWIDERIINGMLASLVRSFDLFSVSLRQTVTGRTSTYITAVVVGFIIIACYLRFA
jgi:NADH-quinone oxidoreductase subunit L